eukprot:RCo027874
MLHSGEVGLGGVREEPSPSRARGAQVALHVLLRRPQLRLPNRDVAHRRPRRLRVLSQPVDGVVVVRQHQQLPILKRVALPHCLHRIRGIQGENHLVLPRGVEVLRHGLPRGLHQGVRGLRGGVDGVRVAQNGGLQEVREGLQLSVLRIQAAPGVVQVHAGRARLVQPSVLPLSQGVDLGRIVSGVRSQEGLALLARRDHTRLRSPRLAVVLHEPLVGPRDVLLCQDAVRGLRGRNHAVLRSTGGGRRGARGVGAAVRRLRLLCLTGAQDLALQGLQQVKDVPAADPRVLPRGLLALQAAQGILHLLRAHLLLSGGGPGVSSTRQEAVNRLDLLLQAGGAANLGRIQGSCV